jgi:hypothetical protein
MRVAMPMFTEGPFGAENGFVWAASLPAGCACGYSRPGPFGAIISNGSEISCPKGSTVNSRG